MPVNELVALDLAELEDLFGEPEIVSGQETAAILLCEECLCTPERCYACCC